MQLARYTQLPLRPYRSPGPRGVDADNYIDWGYAIRGTKHVGDDIRARAGTPVYCVAHGVLKMAMERGTPATSNWGWVLVVEHEFRDGTTWCTIYGHTRPTVYRVGDFIPTGSTIGRIADYNGSRAGWANHLHFAVHRGAFAAKQGTYPQWLTGYLKPAAFPAGYVEPYGFCIGRFPRDTGDQAGDAQHPRAIRSNTPLEGEGIDTPGDEDWFSFKGAKGRTVQLTVTREYGALVPQLAIYEVDAKGRASTRVARGSAEEWRSAIPGFKLPRDGMYLVKIRGAGSTTGIYRFEKTL